MPFLAIFSSTKPISLADKIARQNARQSYLKRNALPNAQIEIIFQ
jgi:hypothetical protein